MASVSVHGFHALPYDSRTLLAARIRTAGHLLSRAGLCPAQNVSAGRRLSNRSRHGCPWLKTTLVQASWA